MSIFSLVVGGSFERSICSACIAMMKTLDLKEFGFVDGVSV